jgi:hypothetical protein
MNGNGWKNGMVVSVVVVTFKKDMWWYLFLVLMAACDKHMEWY